MSTLLLVRHGQARAFDADSDRLTERGEEQARVLGTHLVRAGSEFDEIWTGTLVRQRRTAELIGEAFAAAGRAFPAPRTLPSWNEYGADAILGSLLPELASRDESFSALVQEFHARAATPERNRHFQRMFEVLMSAWESGAVGHPDVEPFASFHARVREALSEITSRGGSRRVLVVTSGGPIGVVVQEVLEAPARSALRVNWRVRNASLTECLFSEQRISLEYFNSVEHLDSSLRTFR